MELRLAKQKLRKEMVVRKRERSAEQLLELSSKIMNRLEETDVFKKASCVALYHAIPGEVQTSEFINRWYKSKRILLPLIVGDDLRLLLYEGAESLTEGQYGIMEPKEDCMELPDEEIDMIIVPGVAFDRDRNRMGRGRGFYDRLLARIEAPKIGICFEFQITDNIPVEPFDKKMDLVITEEHIY